MSNTTENIDDLEEMLADLEGLDDEALAALEEPVAVEPAVTPEPDLSEEDLDGLDELLVEAEPEPAVEAEPVAAATVEPDEPMFTEAEMAEAEALAEAGPSVEALMHHTPTFKPKSTALKLFIDQDLLKRDLEFTTSNISHAMTRQASLFAHYAQMAAQAQFQADRCKQQVDLVEAELDQFYRDEFTVSKVKFTEPVIRAAITKDSKYQKALTKSLEAKAIADMVKIAADSFRHRRDMLIQVGADLREEMKGKVVVRDAAGNVSAHSHPGKAALAAMGQKTA